MERRQCGWALARGRRGRVRGTAAPERRSDQACVAGRRARDRCRRSRRNAVRPRITSRHAPTRRRASAPRPRAARRAAADRARAGILELPARDAETRRLLNIGLRSTPALRRPRGPPPRGRVSSRRCPGCRLPIHVGRCAERRQLRSAWPVRSADPLGWPRVPRRRSLRAGAGEHLDCRVPARARPRRTRPVFHQFTSMAGSVYLPARLAGTRPPRGARP
jgi:hypothetical protein